MRDAREDGFEERQAARAAKERKRLAARGKLAYRGVEHGGYLIMPDRTVYEMRASGNRRVKDLATIQRVIDAARDAQTELNRSKK